MAFPFTVTVLVPLWIARSGPAVHSPEVGTEWALVVAGAALLLIGLLLFVTTVRLFVTVGRGTLAPWDPPTQFVASGPYRYVRNPMISGVLFVLFGEALILRSWPHLEWAVIFLIINLVYVPLLEEPQLAERFGEPYREYRRHVGRFIPRLQPWRND